MQENQSGIFGQHKHDIRFSRRGPPAGTKYIFKVPELGKNIAPVKIWLPQQLRDDLHVLAEHANVLLSRFTREIVIGAVLGRGTLPERPELRAFNATPEADAWERGEPVPMRVEEDRVNAGELRDYEVETIYPEQVGS